MITSEPEGYFKTGLSVNVFPRVGRGIQIADMKHSFMNNRDLMPTSAIVSTEEGPLRTARRFFRGRRGKVFGIEVPELNLYNEFTHNTQTGTIYVLTFETPSEKWESDEEIARTMLKSRVLDPKI